MEWADGQIKAVEVLSKKGALCRIDPGRPVKVTQDGTRVLAKTLNDGSIAFDTQSGARYMLEPIEADK
jgi:hypothetical protein